MTFMHWLSSALLVAAVLSAVRAAYINRQLRRLPILPQRGDRLLGPPSQHAHDGFSLFDAGRVLPPHWRRDLHADRGAQLLDQLYLCLIATIGFGGLGLTLFEILAPAG